MQSLLVTTSENEEEFSLSLCHVVSSMHKSGFLDVLEEISYLGSDPFTLIDLVLPTNSYMISCTNSQSFIEEGENCAFSTSVVHLEPLFLILGFDTTLFGSNFKFQEISVILGIDLITIGVKNQAPQVSFKNSKCWGFCISFFS